MLFHSAVYSLVCSGNWLDLIQYKTVYSLVYSGKSLDLISIKQGKTVENGCI